MSTGNYIIRMVGAMYFFSHQHVMKFPFTELVWFMDHSEQFVHGQPIWGSKRVSWHVWGQIVPVGLKNIETLSATLFTLLRCS